MRLDWLTTFLRVAEHGQISTAAVSMHMSQSTLSRQIAGLESDLGVSLLVRGSRGITLTSAGRLLLRRAGLLLGQVDELRELVEAEARDTALTRVGIPPGVPPAWVTKHVLSAPKGVILNEWTTNEQLDLLANGNLDVALTHERSGSFPSRVVLRQRFGLAIAADSVLHELVSAEGALDVHALQGARILAHASSAVRSSEGTLHSLAASAGMKVDWVFRRFSQFPDIVASSARVDGAVTTESHGFPESSGWNWYPIVSESPTHQGLVVTTWANWRHDAPASTLEFTAALPALEGD